MTMDNLPVKPEETVDSHSVYKGRILNLRVDTVRLPDGGEAKREIVEHNGSVVIVALDDKGQAILVRQFRKPTGEFLLEATAGTLEDGEDPDVCARRELEEETGYIAGDMRRIGSFWIAPGFCTEYMYAYVATELRRGTVNQDDDEDIEVVKVPLNQVSRMIVDGEIRDGKSIAALLMALYLFDDQLNLSNKRQ